MNRILTVGLLTLLFAGESAFSVDGIEEITDSTLKPGDPAPAWTDLRGVDGKSHSSKEIPADRIIVVCFTSNTCPYSVDYEARLNALHARLTKEGDKAVLVAINSNGIAADDLEHMQQRADEKKFGFAYLKDDKQTVARAFGAIYTPEFFVLGKDRHIVYRGAMDDVTDESKVTARYVELAVDAALSGVKPETDSFPARGCTIRYNRERKKTGSAR